MNFEDISKIYLKSFKSKVNQKVKLYLISKFKITFNFFPTPIERFAIKQL